MAIDLAMAQAERATDRERGLIEALHGLYDADAQPDSVARDRAYIEDLRELHEAYADDAEIGTLRAGVLMTASAWEYWWPDGRPRSGTIEAMKALDGVLEDDLLHPGANHFFIHLLENSQDPEVAAPHADRLEATMPGAGHIIHMPSHIFIRTGRYREAIAANRRSLAADLVMQQEWGDRDFPWRRRLTRCHRVPTDPMPKTFCTWRPCCRATIESSWRRLSASRSFPSRN